MINSNTSFGKLKDIIVGVELEIPKRMCDFTFRHFYSENLGDCVYDLQDVKDYKIDHELLVLRNKQLDALAKTLEDEGITVHRPDRVKQLKSFKTPHFDSFLSSASNVRDVTMVYKDKVVETPTYVTNRYFENLAMYDIFNKTTDYGSEGQWIRCPHTELSKETLDLEHWKEDRDFENFDKDKFVMAIDGAQFLRIGKDVIVNVKTYNHYMGYLWVKSMFPDTDFHMISITDNHIDGAIICLKPGEFLIGHDYLYIIDQLPEKFQKWNFLVPEERVAPVIKKSATELDVQLASSRGMDINILSIDENTVVVNKDAVNVISLLEKNGYRVIQVELDNCEIFGGGIHCSTLDLNREDEYKYYTD